MLTQAADKNCEIYRKWVNKGWIRVTKENYVDYDQIRDNILKDSEQFNIKLIGFDVCNATQLRTQLQNIGLDVQSFPQTYARYSTISKNAEVFISRKRIKHNAILF